jgi:hypothetical protein
MGENPGCRCCAIGTDLESSSLEGSYNSWRLRTERVTLEREFDLCYQCCTVELTNALHELVGGCSEMGRVAQRFVRRTLLEATSFTKLPTISAGFNNKEGNLRWAG